MFVELVSSDEVDGQRDLDFVLLSFGHQVLDDAGALLVIQGGTDLTGAGGREKRFVTYMKPAKTQLKTSKSEELYTKSIQNGDTLNILSFASKTLYSAIYFKIYRKLP